MPQRKRHAVLTCGFVQRLDSNGMLRTLARLRGSALRGRALGRAIVILALAMTLGFADQTKISTAIAEDTQEIQKPFHEMNLKLYLHNKLNDWDQFECANWLGIKESNWRVNAKNKETGAWGIFQHMSDHAHKWDGYQQIDKHIEYINHRYDGSWCKALRHLETQGWH